MGSKLSSFARPLTSLTELEPFTTIVRAWGRLRLMKLVDGPRESPDFRLLHHFVSVNLGERTQSEVRVEDGPWNAYPLAHLGCIFIPAGIQHTARNVPRQVLLLEVDAQFAEGVLRSCGEDAMLRPLIGFEDPVIAHIALALADEVRGTGVLEQVHTEALGAALLTRLAFHSASERQARGGGGLPPSRLHRVLDHVAGHLDAPPTLNALAEIAGVELYRFVRAFKKSTGLTPHRYILDARIAHAKDLLRNRSLSISDVAVRTGFSTPSHFSVTFRRATGTSPGEFRRKPSL